MLYVGKLNSNKKKLTMLRKQMRETDSTVLTAGEERKLGQKYLRALLSSAGGEGGPRTGQPVGAPASQSGTRRENISDSTS